jgi:hypothetical protein
MDGCTRRLILVLLAVGLGLSTGCDAATLAYFFMKDGREDPKIKNLASADPKKIPRVVILTWAGLETRSEFIHADRQLSEMLGRQLTDLAEGNEEKLTIVPSRKVEEYKNNHSNWREKDLAEIGRAFEADYVIYMEINAMSMYETGSGNSLFRGRTQMTLTLVDVKHPDETPAQQPFSCTYPSEAKGAIPAGFDDNTPANFRQQFLAYVAKRLSYYFSKYSKRETWFTE